VTVFARLVDAESGFAEPLPQGWTAVDSSTAAFEVTLTDGDLPPTGSSSVLPQAMAAAVAICLGWLLLMIRTRRRNAP
jgi:hypothetical protein